jgi:hypothetical protein
MRGCLRGVGLNSRLLITIPADGFFVLGVTHFPDFEFAGGGVGTYRLTVANFASIGSISGRVIDAVTGDPLPGDADPFSFVELLRCEGQFCDFVSFQNPDSNGRFAFTTDFNGQPLEVGTYQVNAFANQYISGSTEPFAVGEGEDHVVDVPLEPLPIRISEIRPCGSLPPEGGTCAYSARITNRSGQAFDGGAWSTVFAFGIGSVVGSTQFQTNQPQSMTLRPGASKVVQFQFVVPPTVANGAFICADTWTGRGRLNPFFDTVAQRFLFCIDKGVGGFSVMRERDAQRVFRQLHPRGAIRRGGK